MADKRFLGLPYPILRNAKGYFYTQSGTDQIKSDLLALLLTQPGERVFLPSFGTPLEKLIFEPNDAILQEKAKNMIINSIRTWEPRIAIRDINVRAARDEDLNPDDDKTQKEHVLMISIKFVDPQNIQKVEELKLEIPLSN